MNLSIDPSAIVPVFLFVVFLLTGALCLYVIPKIRRRFTENLKMVDILAVVLLALSLITDTRKVIDFIKDDSWWWVNLSGWWFSITFGIMLFYVVNLFTMKGLERIFKRFKKDKEG
jgi:hypothetical protein